jgi:hypothetical protein
MNDKTWPEMLAAYFGEVLTKREMDLWWDELRDPERGIRGVTNEEVCEAIREASFRDRPKYAGKPDLKELRIWVFMYRKAHRLNIYGDEAPPESCAMCTRGWLMVWPDGPMMLTLTQAIPMRSVVVPCKCSAGQRVGEKDPDYQNMTEGQSVRIQALQDLGIRQNASIERHAETIGKDTNAAVAA